jgi:hypothetical protein
MKVTERHRERVRRVCPRLHLDLQKALHHARDRVFGPCPTRSHRALHVRWGVLEDLHPPLGRREERHAASVSQHQSAPRVPKSEDALDGHGIRSVEVQGERELLVELLESHLEGRLGVHLENAMSHVT